jgi:ABC-type transporter Mla subunit MlaD
MEHDRAELAALATSLDDLAARVTAAADRFRGTTRADLADGLYDVERSLLGASRKLEQVLRTMR